LRSTLWPMLVALPVLTLAAWWAVHRGVAPLRTLGRTLARREPHAADPVVLDSAPSEMMPMLDALNALLRRIGTLVESERQFTADAAHELRTPIAAIRAQAQVALAEPDQALRHHALLATLQGCDRATRLVEQLLTLSRLEAGTARPKADIDLAALVRQVVADLAPDALRKQQTIELDAADGCKVRGDETLVAVLVRNLVDNAIRYSPAGAAVKVRLATRDSRLSLNIEDSGPGMDPTDMQRIGERFFRVLGSGQEGSGLGWSIVRRIAAVHAATVHVGRSEALGGLSVQVDWAAQAAA
jgi:two-component system sensor histidine kinase QseC